MLQMRKTCELCGVALKPTGEAFICSYECTYCPACYEGLDKCPNCAGELVRRPRRTTGAAAITQRAPARVVRRLRTALGR